MSSHLATGIKYQFQAVHNLDVITPNIANVFIASDPGPITVTLSPPTDPDGEPNWFYIKNQDEANRALVTLSPSTGMIDNDPVYAIPWPTGVLVVFDGTNWFTFSGGGL